MRNIKRLATILTTVSLLGWGAAGIEARTGKGDRFYSQGSQAEQAGELEKALQAYEQALADDPSDPLYQMSVRRMRFQAAQARVSVAQKLRNEGKLEEALAEFEKAYAIDPSSPIAEQELRRTLEMIDREKRRATPQPPAERGLTPAAEARRAADERMASVMGIPELKPISKQAIELTANNQPPARIIETVCKLAGINVIFDTDSTARLPTNPMSVAFKNVTLEEALNYIALQARVFWKPITSNAIFVTVDNPQRRTEIEEQVTKVFYINNTGAAAQTDLNELRNMVTQMTGATRVAPSLSQNALIMRGTADQVQLAEMLIRNLDRAKAEVVVDVILLEANRTRSRDLSLNPVSAGANGLSIPITYSPRNPVTTTGTGGTGTASTGAVRLSQVGKTDFGDYSVTLPGAILEAFMSDGGARILQSPQIRTVDGMKASLKIGEKVPYSSGGFQPTFGQVGGTGLNSLYNSFQFLDVGVNVDITPKVHGSDEVTLHIDLDVLAVKERIEIAGISQPVVGRRWGTPPAQESRRSWDPSR